MQFPMLSGCMPAPVLASGACARAAPSRAMAVPQQRDSMSNRCSTCKPCVQNASIDSRLQSQLLSDCVHCCIHRVSCMKLVPARLIVGISLWCTLWQRMCAGGAGKGVCWACRQCRDLPQGGCCMLQHTGSNCWETPDPSRCHLSCSIALCNVCPPSVASCCGN